MKQIINRKLLWIRTKKKKIYHKKMKIKFKKIQQDNLKKKYINTNN